MTAAIAPSLQDAAREASRRVMDLVFRDGQPLVVVDSPPGAGKTWLAESVVAVGVRNFGLRVAVCTPRVEQAYDLLRRLTGHFAGLRIQHFASSNRDVPDDIEGNRAFLPTARKPGDLAAGPCAIVCTVAKLQFSVPDLREEEFDLVICDEAYQAAFAEFVPVFHVGTQTLLIGDPGQLPPLVRVDVARFEAARVKVHRPVPLEVTRRFANVPVVRLPVTRRLLQDTVEVVQPALYLELPFGSAVNTADRRIRFAASGMQSPIDRVLDLVSAGASLVGLLLPASPYPVGDVDEEVSELMAQLARRVLDRGAATPQAGVLDAWHIGCTDSHVASNALLAKKLRARGFRGGQLVTDTPEQWQGLERPLMIVKHPLSGKERPDPFGLDPGRLCVMLSRHQGACVIVSRAGVGRALDAYDHDCSERAMQAPDEAWKGWRAHSQVWTTLEESGRMVRA